MKTTFVTLLILVFIGCKSTQSQHDSEAKEVVSTGGKVVLYANPNLDEDLKVGKGIYSLLNTPREYDASEGEYYKLVQFQVVNLLTGKTETLAEIRSGDDGNFLIEVFPNYESDVRPGYIAITKTVADTKTNYAGAYLVLKDLLGQIYEFHGGEESLHFYAKEGHNTDSIYIKITKRL